MMLPLEGITIVSLEQAVAAPFATRQLADLGARVIKVERPEVGDFARGYDTTVHGLSSHFVWLNRSKESIALDLKDPTGKKNLEKLVEQADVFIHNLAPGAVDRLGFDAKSLSEKYPELINCSISGYGTNGSYKDKKAYDLLIQCETGHVSVTGTEETPSKAGISIADIAAGMYAYSGILTALLARTKTGEGDVIEISMLEALGEWMGYPLYYANYGGEEPKRNGASHSTIAPYGPYNAKDEKKVFLGIQNEREWARFCENIINKPDLKEDERFQSNSKRVENRELLDKIINDELTKMESKDIIHKLDTEKIANARLNTMKEFMQHPQLRERKRWREVDSPAGKIQALVSPITSQNFETVMKPIPGVGEHSEKILKEFNLTELV